MRRIALMSSIVALAVAALVPANAAATYVVQVSNFRFCPDRPFACDPADESYLADPNANGAPLVEQYNPIPTITAHRGDTIRWYYADALCDAISGCPGHVVDFVGEPKLAQLDARTAGEEVSFTIPADWAAGQHPYRCTLNSHYQFGMTGLVVVE